MENNPVQVLAPTQKNIPPITAGILALAFAVLSLIFHDAANAGLAMIIGIFGIVKGDRIGKILSIIGVIIGIGSFLLFNPFQSSQQLITANGNIYSNSEYNFKITPPVNWKINSNPKRGIVAFVDLNAPEKDMPAIAVNLFPGENLNLDDYVKNSLDQLSLVPNYTLIKKDKLGIDNSSYYLIETSMLVDEALIHSLIIIRQAGVGKFFTITGLSEGSVWSTYDKIIRDSILSFTN